MNQIDKIPKDTSLTTSFTLVASQNICHHWLRGYHFFATSLYCITVAAVSGS